MSGHATQLRLLWRPLFTRQTPSGVWSRGYAGKQAAQPDNEAPYINDDYRTRRRYLEAQAEEALLKMIRSMNSKLRDAKEFEERNDAMPLPWTAIENAGLATPRLRQYDTEFRRALSKYTAAVQEGREIVLDQLHQPFPTSSPDPYEAYREDMLKLTKAEQAVELKRLTQEIHEDDTALEQKSRVVYDALVAADQRDPMSYDEFMAHQYPSDVPGINADDVDIASEAVATPKQIDDRRGPRPSTEAEKAAANLRTRKRKERYRSAKSRQTNPQSEIPSATHVQSRKPNSEFTDPSAANIRPRRTNIRSEDSSAAAAELKRRIQRSDDWSTLYSPPTLADARPQQAVDESQDSSAAAEPKPWIRRSDGRSKLALPPASADAQPVLRIHRHEVPASSVSPPASADDRPKSTNAQSDTQVQRPVSTVTNEMVRRDRRDERSSDARLPHFLKV